MIIMEQAKTFGGEGIFEEISSVPPLVCDPEMVNEIVGYMKELRVPGATAHPDVKATASEDFAVIAEKVPSVFIYLSAGFENWRGEATAHNPKVQFSEDALPYGAAVYVQCAMEWLKEHK